ncbi:MAG: nicotinic acid mononucleotide adenylyltransferase, partial [Hyphomicrobium sp.]
LVTPGNPLKSSQELAPLQDRLKKIQARIRDRRIKALSVEEELGTHFTANVLYYLKGRCSRIKFVWIMGADNLASFNLWNDWDLIINQMPFLIVDRPHWRFKALSSRVALKLASCRLKEERYKNLFKRRTPTWVFLTNRLFVDSSTEIRRHALK